MNREEEKLKSKIREPIRISRTFLKDLFISILTRLSGDFLSKMRLNGIRIQNQGQVSL